MFLQHKTVFYLKKEITIIGIFIGIAILSALFWGFTNRPTKLQGDAYEYAVLAKNIAATHSFTYDGQRPSMFRDPLYPLLLTSFFFFTDDLNKIITLTFIIQTLLLIIVIIFIYYFLSNYNKTLAFISALLIGLAPPTAYLTGQILSETLFIALLIPSLLILIRGIELNKASYLFLAGIFWGGGTLTRSVIMFFPLFFLIITTLLFKKWFKQSIVFLVGFLLIVSPWLIRNTILFSTPSITTRTGYTLLVRSMRAELSPSEMKQYVLFSLLGPSKILKNHENGPQDIFASKMLLGRFSELYQQGRNEAEIDKIFLKEAIAKIKMHPFMYGVQSIFELVILNAPPVTIFHTKLPVNLLSNIFITILYVILYAIVLWYSIKIIKYKHQLFNTLAAITIIFIIYYNGTMSFFPTTPRYNIPLLPFYFILFSAWLTERFQKHSLVKV